MNYIYGLLLQLVTFIEGLGLNMENLLFLLKNDENTWKFNLSFKKNHEKINQSRIKSYEEREKKKTRNPPQ